MAIAERPPYLHAEGQSLAEIAHRQMLALIDDGSWSARSRLPSEAELARRFGMSRPIIRQALARLRDAGLIQSRQGSGSFVIGPAPIHEQPPERVAFPAIGSIADMTAFASFREGLEGEIAATAALRRSRSDLASIRDVLARFTEERSLGERPHDDFAFHMAIARATGNPFYVNSMSSLHDHMMLGMGLLWKFSSDGEDFRVQVTAQHQAIYAAILTEDVELARDTMKQHVRWAYARALHGGSAEPAAM